jgi:transglycosylase-like protein with SLT domain
MAARDLWDLLQPTWADRMGATAWDPPNLPLFEGGPWPTPTVVRSAGDVGQTVPWVTGVVGNPLLPQDQSSFAPDDVSLLRLLANADNSGRAPHTTRMTPTDVRAAAGAPSDQRGQPAPSYVDANSSTQHIPLPRARPAPFPPPKYLGASPWWPDAAGMVRDDVEDQIAGRWPTQFDPNRPAAWLPDMSAVLPAIARPTPELKLPMLKSNGIDPDDLIARMTNAESSGNPNAVSRATTASGLGQFTARTWLGLLNARRPELTRGRTPDDLLPLRFDPTLSRQMTAAYADDNAGALNRAHLPITAATLYLAHFLGPHDAVKILQADQNTPAATIVHPESLARNRTVIAPRSAGQMLDWASDKMKVARQAWPAP